jgi:hypothetical protein
VKPKDLFVASVASAKGCPVRILKKKKKKKKKKKYSLLADVFHRVPIHIPDAMIDVFKKNCWQKA